MTTEPETKAKEADLKTFSQLMAFVPKDWRNAEVAIGVCIGTAKKIRRVSLHKNESGRRIILIHDEVLKIGQ